MRRLIGPEERVHGCMAVPFACRVAAAARGLGHFGWLIAEQQDFARLFTVPARELASGVVGMDALIEGELTTPIGELVEPAYVIVIKKLDV